MQICRPIPWRPPLRLAVLGLALLLAGGGCTLRQGDFTVMTNKLVKLDRVDIDKLPVERNVEGEDTRLVSLLLIGFPAAFWPTLESAVDDALKKGDGDLMTDVVVSTTVRNFLLFATSTLKVEGDVVRTRGSNP